MSNLKREHRNAKLHLHWKTLSIAIIFIAIALAGISIPKVHAPSGSETYRLYLSSFRNQETNTPPETLYLNVSNAGIGSNYRFGFAVTDPSGTVKTATNQTIATTASFVLSIAYPRDFPSTSIRFVGNYTINVSQSQPSNKASVATGSFIVGLTDSKTYQRTSTISTKATGYASSEIVNTTLNQGTNPIGGFPSWIVSDTNGDLNFTWRIPPSDPLGTYTLTLTGTVTTKTIPDSQTFTVAATTILIPGMTVKSSTITRTLTQQLILAPQYQDGQRVQTGDADIRIAETDGVNVANVTASYDNLTGTFHSPYYVPKTAMTGIWIATIDPTNFDDGYGNTGPVLTVTAGFNVQPADLNVSFVAAAIGTHTYGPGDLIP